MEQVSDPGKPNDKSGRTLQASWDRGMRGHGSSYFKVCKRFCQTKKLHAVLSCMLEPVRTEVAEFNGECVAHAEPARKMLSVIVQAGLLENMSSERKSCCPGPTIVGHRKCRFTAFPHAENYMRGLFKSW